MLTRSHCAIRIPLKPVTDESSQVVGTRLRLLPYSLFFTICISHNAHPKHFDATKEQFELIKTLALTLMLGMGSLLAGCGASSKNANINGNWTATLMDTGGTESFAFSTALLATGSSGTVTIKNFRFSTNSPCFVSGETESGTFAISGDFSGNVSGQFGMNILSGSPGGNTLALTGTVKGNTISGTWILAGSSGCTGNGSFTMTRM